jgi:hypothetical protein
MEERDIIISAFACGGKMSCQKEAEKFAEPPLVLTVPGGSSSGFRKTGMKYKSGNTILDNFLKDKAKNVKPRRICLVTFSAGWAWSTEVLRTKLDPSRIDTVIVMDGIHTRSLDGWFRYAELCVKGGKNGPKLFMAHTQIKPPFVSSKTTNTNIINSAREVDDGSWLITVPTYVWDVDLEKPISVYSKIENPKTKIFQDDPLHTFEAVGNVVRVEYEGGKAQDHIYNAQYSQPRYWEWLRNLWKDPNAGVRYE